MEAVTLRTAIGREIKLADAMEELVKCGSVRSVGTNASGEPLYSFALLHTAARTRAVENHIEQRKGCIRATVNHRSEQYAQAARELGLSAPDNLPLNR